MSRVLFWDLSHPSEWQNLRESSQFESCLRIIECEEVPKFVANWPITRVALEMLELVLVSDRGQSCECFLRLCRFTNSFSKEGSRKHQAKLKPIKGLWKPQGSSGATVILRVGWSWGKGAKCLHPHITQSSKVDCLGSPLAEADPSRSWLLMA